MTDPVDPHERAVAQLEQLGLSEYEAHTFVALVQLGKGTAKDVADLNHVPRTRVYDAVEALHDRGLVDVQHSTPQTFTTVSHETALKTLRLDYENLIVRLERALGELEPAQPLREELGVWTTTGCEATTSRVLEFIDDTEDELIYMTVDDLLTDTHLDHLERAAERGVDLCGVPAANHHTTAKRTRRRSPRDSPARKSSRTPLIESRLFRRPCVAKALHRTFNTRIISLIANRAIIDE